jgi:hypothetical protein
LTQRMIWLIDYWLMHISAEHSSDIRSIWFKPSDDILHFAH